MTRDRLVAAVAFALVLCLAGCGSEADTASSGPTLTTSRSESGSRGGVGEPFAARAAAACDLALEAKQGWATFPVAGFDPSQPDSSAFPQVAAWLETEVGPTFEAWLEALTTLGTPPAGEESWDDVLSAIDTIVNLNSQQVTAAMTDDAAAFVEAHDNLQAIQPELERATAAAGVPTCADVHE